MSALKLLFVLIIIIDINEKPTQGCAPQTPPPPVVIKTTTTKKPRLKGDAVDRNLPQAWGGFEVPEKVKTKWKNWINDYKIKMNQLALESDEKYKNQRGPGSGWPDSWQGIGGGHGGDPPPPWSYQPINTGLPEYCYLPPDRGPCTDRLITRWAYNPYVDDCVEFKFACDGNQNNFDTKLRCIKMCMIEPVIGCDVDTNIYIDE